MTIAYPRTDIDVDHWIESVSFLPEPVQEMSRSSRKTTVKEMAPARWVAVVTSVSMPNEKALRLQSKLISLNGAQHAFELSDPRRKRPITAAASFPDNAVLGTLPTNAYELVLEGLPAGFILSEGDYLSFTYASTLRAFHQVLETVTANGSGVTPAFGIYPRRRIGTAAGAAVKMAPAKALMYLVPRSLKISSNGPLQSVISFEASE